MAPKISENIIFFLLKIGHFKFAVKQRIYWFFDVYLLFPVDTFLSSSGLSFTQKHYESEISSSGYFKEAIFLNSR